MDEATYALLFASALGSIRRDGANVDPREVSERLRDSNPAFAGMNLTEFRRIFDRAYATAAQAGTMNDATTVVEPISSYPIDPTIGPGQPRLAWRVAVKWDDGRGNKGETLVYVRSNESQTAEDVYAAAIRDVMLGIQESETPRGEPRGTPDYSAHIITGGRRN